MSEPIEDSHDSSFTLRSKFAVGWIGLLAATVSSVQALYGTHISTKWIGPIVFGITGGFVCLNWWALKNLRFNVESGSKLKLYPAVATILTVTSFVFMVSSFVRGIFGAEIRSAYELLIAFQFMIMLFALLVANVATISSILSYILKRAKGKD